jgi:ABC-type Fe3+-siderophore transport system permease subunit
MKGPSASHAHPAPPPPLTISHLPPRWDPPPIRPPLPIGVAVLSVLIALVGALLLVSGCLFLLHYYFPTAVPATLLILSSIDVVGGAILVLFGAVLISVATALWRQETWALWTTVVVVFLALTYLFFTGSITVLFVVFLLLFIYLLTVRHHFY